MLYIFTAVTNGLKLLLALVLFDVLGKVNANAIRPRVLKLLPREEIVTLPLIARGITPGSGITGNAETTVAATTTTITGEKQSKNGWSAVSSAVDRQSYYTVIKVGDINFRVALDTGSSDLWLFSSQCQDQSCREFPKYPLSYASPSFEAVNENTTAYSIGYADGTSVSGFLAREKVELGQMTVLNQTIGLVSTSNVTMSDQESGILGLGFPRLSTISNTVTNSTPFFAALAQQGLVDYPLFGFSLTNDLHGSLSLGAVDASIVINPNNISWSNVAQFSPFGAESNVSSYLNWAIPLESVGVNGTQLVPIPSQAAGTRNISLALFDVGTPGIYGPYQDVSRVFDLIDGARLVDAESGQWVIPCDTEISMSFTFNRREYLLQPSDYIIGATSGSPNLCLSWPRALPPGSDGVDWQIGSAFMRTVYSIFSYGINSKEPPKIGLYPLSANNATSTSTTTIPTNTIPTASSIQLLTIETNLPNFPIATPIPTTPAYIFNTSIPASIGGIVTAGLATSTYSAILAKAQATTGFNGSDIPVQTISALPSIVTLTTTDDSGSESITVSTLRVAPLGIPPGDWNSASGRFGGGRMGLVLGLMLGGWLLL